jgi:hypothetical protein
MKPPTFAPAYVGLFPILAEVAQQHGYALAVHGSVSRDFDLVAIPWAKAVADAETLIRAIAAAMSYTMDTAITPDRLMEPPYTEHKPHGRRSWAIPLDCGALLDVSVLPVAVHSPDTAAEVAFADTSPITPAALEQLGYERKSDTRFTGTDSTIWLRDGVAEIKIAHLQASQIRTLGQLRHLVAALAERTA